MTIRIGIAGVGSHALGRILPVIAAEPRMTLAATWTRSATSQAQLRERGCPVVTSDFEQFLTTPMDVVYVATPTGLHFTHAAAVLDAGLHAWVEKPLATTLEEVQVLTARAEAGKRMLAEAFMFPWHAQAASVRQVLSAGHIGAVRSVALTFCFPHLDPGNFRYKPELGGGAFLDHACYLVNALDTYAGGEWSVLGGCIDHAQHAVDVSGTALLRRNADGVVATLDWGFGRSYVNEIRFTGTHGRLLVESAFTKPASRSCNLSLEDGQGRQTSIDVPREDPYRRMLEGFIDLYRKPDSWPELRLASVRHAERYFALREVLQQYR